MKQAINALIVVALLGITSGCQDAETTADPNGEAVVRPAKLLTISLNNQLRQRTFPGQIEASRRSNLSFRVSGQLVEIPATPGMDVKQGDLLAKLDTTDFEHILAERKASLDLAKTRYNQIKKLFDKTYSTQAQLDEATATLRSAQAAVAIATDNLRYTSLTAPFDGIVARVDAKNFQTITAQQPFLQLHNVDDLDVVFTMPETLLQQMRNNIENPENVCAVVTFSAQTDQTYTACFKEFEGVPDPLTRGYKVVFTMPPIDEFPVLPGMSVNLVVDFSAYLRDAGASGIQVPLSAVFEQENKSWVWKLDDDSRVTQTEVEVARIEGAQLMITSGLQDGDQIVVSGVNQLRQGQAVRALQRERGL